MSERTARPIDDRPLPETAAGTMKRLSPEYAIDKPVGRDAYRRRPDLDAVHARLDRAAEWVDDLRRAVAIDDSGLRAASDDVFSQPDPGEFVDAADVPVASIDSPAAQHALRNAPSPPYPGNPQIPLDERVVPDEPLTDWMPADGTQPRDDVDPSALIAMVRRVTIARGQRATDLQTRRDSGRATAPIKQWFGSLGIAQWYAGVRTQRRTFLDLVHDWRDSPYDPHTLTSRNLQNLAEKHGCLGNYSPISGSIYAEFVRANNPIEGLHFERWSDAKRPVWRITAADSERDPDPDAADPAAETEANTNTNTNAPE